MALTSRGVSISFIYLLNVLVCKKVDIYVCNMAAVQVCLQYFAVFIWS